MTSSHGGSATGIHSARRARFAAAALVAGALLVAACSGSKASPVSTGGNTKATSTGATATTVASTPTTKASSGGYGY